MKYNAPKLPKGSAEGLTDSALAEILLGTRRVEKKVINRWQANFFAIAAWMMIYGMLSEPSFEEVFKGLHGISSIALIILLASHSLHSSHEVVFQLGSSNTTQSPEDTLRTFSWILLFFIFALASVAYAGS